MKTRHLLLNDDPNGAGGGNPNPANPNPAPTDWTTGLNDELKGYAQLKGYKDVGSVIESYRALEKHMGAPKERLLTLPEKADDVEGWKNIHARLGRPEKADDYQITLKPEAGDEKFVGGMKNKFHELGLSKTQGENLMKWYGEHFDGQVAEATKEMEVKSAAEVNNLKTEWGAAFDQNNLIAKKAVESFKIAPEAIDALQDVMGYDGVFKFLHSIGSKIGEDTFHSGSGGAGFGGQVLSPEAARVAIQQKMSDTDFGTKLRNGDNAAMAEWNQLNKWAYGT